jgi:hypothetical protein
MSFFGLAPVRSLAFRSPVRYSRSFMRSVPNFHGGPEDPHAEKVSLTWYNKKKDEFTKVQAAVGSTLLQVAHRNGIDLEGACEGSVACSTCHVILEPDVSGRCLGFASHTPKKKTCMTMHNHYSNLLTSSSFFCFFFC